MIKNASIHNLAKLFLTFCLLGFLSCERNHSPTINNILQNPTGTSAGQTYTLKAIAIDPDDDFLSYQWSADQGEFISSTEEDEVLWKSPIDGSGKSYDIIVVVSDGKDEVSMIHSIQLSQPFFSDVAGFVYFTNTKIPIDGAQLILGDLEATSQIDGHYSFKNVLAIEDTLKVLKDDFSPLVTTISIPKDQDLIYNVEMTSIIHSTNIFGIVYDQDSTLVNNADVIVLNPDGSESQLIGKTNTDGVYRIPYVPHGTRQIVAAKLSNEDIRYSEMSITIESIGIEQRIDFFIHKTLLNGFFLDPRDSTTYHFKTIGNQTWMTNNLAYLPSVNPGSIQSEGSRNYYVYGYNGSTVEKAKATSNFESVGVLYNWEAAMNSCPSGWHLPSLVEWQDLFNYLGSKEAYKMKTTSGWTDEGNGSNSSGFSAVPSGLLNNEGSFILKGSTAKYYSSLEQNLSDSEGISLSSHLKVAMTVTDSKKVAYSVRCIRN